MNSLQLDELRLALAGRYRIEEPVGQGAMAVVFRAQDLRHDRPVALKVLRSELRECIGTERFLREVQLAARLQHPHIVPLFDSGSAAGHVYYVMPFLAEETLRARLDRDGPLAVDEAVGIALQVAQALGYAHRHGVIHRDIKPENILLHEGNALVADFGVAFAVTGAADQRLTATGLTVGTPAYMSPEQATGAPVDGRSDLYSLASVLYEMLTDELPHAGRSAAEVVARKLTEPVRSVRDLRRNTPPPVAAALERALAASPEDRFASIEEFSAALEGRAVHAQAPRRPRSRRAILALGLGSVAVGAGAFLVSRWTVGEPGPIDPYLIAAAPLAATDQAGARSLEELLGAELPGVPGPHLVPVSSEELGRARRQARALGAGQLLHGTATAGSANLTIRLQLEDVARGRVLGQLSAIGSKDSLPRLATELAVGVLQLQAARGDPAIVPTLTRSLPALRAFTTGMAQYRMARYPGAARSFTRAIEADSSFALAGLWLLLTAQTYGGEESALAYTWDRRARLGQRDQVLLRALAGPDYPASMQLAQRLAGLEEAVSVNDDRPELWALLGTFLVRYGSYLGLPDGPSRAEGALLQALRYDPDCLTALEKLVEVRGALGNLQGLRWAAHRFLAVDSSSELAPFVRWRLAQVEGTSAARRRLVASMNDWNGVSLHQLIWTTQLEGLPPDDALAASDALLRRATSPEGRVDRLITRHDLLANLGRSSEAAATIRQMREEDPTWTGWSRYALSDALFWDGDPELAGEALDLYRRDFAELPRAASATRAREVAAACWVGLWHAMRESPDTALLAATRIERSRSKDAAPSSRPDCGDVLRTIRAVRAGTPGARERLDSLERVVRPGRLLPGLSGATNLLLSDLYRQVGDIPAAHLAATRFWYWGRTMYVSPYLYRAGMAALDNRDSADARIRLLRVATLWAAGDSTHRLRADSLRRLATLLQRGEPGRRP
jgi:tRNA A-37 threonylcarbamoyl transferase component Bud32/tetratricopeptide (TPR) repeat protein